MEIEKVSQHLKATSSLRQQMRRRWAINWPTRLKVSVRLGTASRWKARKQRKLKRTIKFTMTTNSVASSNALRRPALRLVNPRTERLLSMGRLLDKVVFVSLLALIVTTAIPYGTVDPWWEALFECAVFGSTALWILEGLLSGDWGLNRFLPIVPLIILTVYSFLQTVQLPTWIVATGAHSAQRMLTVDQYQTHLTTLKILSLTAFLGLLLIHVSTPKRLTWL